MDLIKGKRSSLCGMIFLIYFCGLFLFPFYAVEPGKALPRVTGEKWYSKEKESGKDLQITVLLDLTSSDTFPLLRMLENMKISSLGKKFSLTVLAMNEEKIADEIMKNFPGYSFSVGLDSRLKMRNLLAEDISLFPHAILAKNGIVQWRGMPTELELVAEKILKGSFSLEKQKKVEGMRKELQIAIQSGLPVVVSSTADRILAILPDDRLAIQSKLFAFNAMRQNDEAEKFIEKICRNNPEDMRLMVMQLDFLLREGKIASFLKKVGEGCRKLKKNSDMLLFLSFVLENAPFGTLDVKELLPVAFSVYEKLGKEEKISSADKALAAEVLARIYSMAGRLADAVRLQNDACKIRKGGNLEKAANDRLKYYRDALEAGGMKLPGKK